MKKLAVCFAGIVLGTAAASAADMPVKARVPVAVVPVATWTGCYGGVNGGYSWGNGSQGLALQPSLAAWTAIDPGYSLFDGRYNSSPSGGLGGVQVGCNYQSGLFVGGLEADVDYLGVNKTTTRTAVVGGLPTQATVSQTLEWLATFRARVGIAPVQNLLLYATGGFAVGYTNFSHSFTRTDTNVGFAGGTSEDFRNGWIAGAGAEYMVTPNWTVRAEYLYYDLGNTRSIGLPFNQPANAFGADALYSTKGSIARVGLNYKFGWAGSVVAKY